jgi:hypothetical protein
MKQYAPLVALGVFMALGIVFASVTHVELKNGGVESAAVSIVLGSSTSTTSTSTAPAGPALVDVLQQLQTQVQSLTSEISDLHVQLGVMNIKSFFTRPLQRGDSGTDVSKLQEILAEIPDVYPADINTSSTPTGYYGYVTEIAITRFQNQHQLKATGNFDAPTQQKFYELLPNLLTQNSTSTEFTPLDLSYIAGLPSADDLQAQISQLASDTATTQSSLNDLTDQIAQFESGLSNVQATTYETITNLQNQFEAASAPPVETAAIPTPTSATTSSVTSTATTPTSTTPAPPPLSISNIQAMNTTKTSSTITWTTNASSTSEVDYSTDSSLSASKTLTVTNSAMVVQHSVVLQNLSPGTAYFYRVVSRSSSGATASSSRQSFNTH